MNDSIPVSYKLQFPFWEFLGDHELELFNFLDIFRKVAKLSRRFLRALIHVWSCINMALAATKERSS